MVRKVKKQVNHLEEISLRITEWVGTPYSLIVHSFFFIGIFALKFAGFGADQILLILTTLVSLEAIYLAVFIQMTVNRQTQSLKSVEGDIEDIQEDVEELSEDVEEITEDIDEDEKLRQTLENIEKQLKGVQEDLSSLKKTSYT